MSKTNGRMAKRTRKSRQSRKRNIYVGGGGGQSAMSGKVKISSLAPGVRPLQKPTGEIDIAFDEIKTPNITYWNPDTLSPFAVFTADIDYKTTYFTIAGIWGMKNYEHKATGSILCVYKNFDYPTKIVGNVGGGKLYERNKYFNSLNDVRHSEILPKSATFTYPLPPKVVVIVDKKGKIVRIESPVVTASDTSKTYEKYDKSKHNIIQSTYPSVESKMTTTPFEATTRKDTDQTGTQSASVGAMDGLRTPGGGEGISEPLLESDA
jgi:hypothetical protein